MVNFPNTKKVLKCLSNLTEREEIIWSRDKSGECCSVAYLRWKFELIWSRGQLEFLMDGVKMENCVAEVKSLQEGIEEQEQRRKPDISHKQESTAASFLRDLSRHNKPVQAKK
ncbi:MAG: hypothetical protein Q7S83_03150 [bacterium]|nr:hypothetical protein [bacterium]